MFARAGNRCEYCRLPAQGQVAPFEIEHIIPTSLGGQTELSNLALACPHWNSHKAAFVTGLVPGSNLPVPLFNPRTQRWSDHFRWSVESLFGIEARTAIGRATVARLRMNHPEMVEARRFMAAVGVFTTREH